MLLSFADECETAAVEGEDIAVRLASAQGFRVAGRQEAEAIEPRTEQEQDDQARLRHVATGLHRSLEEARVELGRTQAALLRSAAAARESAPTGGSVETVHTDLLNRTLRAASTEGHRVDEVVSRVSSQTSTVVAAIDSSGQAARDRMRAHRDLPGAGAGRVEGVQQDRVTSLDPGSQGEGLRSFAAACEEAGQAGLGVDRPISRAVANLEAAVVMVDGLHPGSTREEIDTGRMRRQLISLQEDLETTRPLMQRVSERLGAEADRARRSLPSFDRHRGVVETDRLSGSLLTASSDGRHVDQELGRAQSLTTQASRGVDLIAQGARERMRIHPKPSRDCAACPSMPR